MGYLIPPSLHSPTPHPCCLLTGGVPWDEDNRFSSYSLSSSMWPVGSQAIIKNSYSHSTPLIYLNSLLIYSESHIQTHQLTPRHCSGLGLHLFIRKTKVTLLGTVLVKGD